MPTSNLGKLGVAEVLDPSKLVQTLQQYRDSYCNAYAKLAQRIFEDLAIIQKSPNQIFGRGEYPLGLLGFKFVPDGDKDIPFTPFITESDRFYPGELRDTPYAQLAVTRIPQSQLDSLVDDIYATMQKDGKASLRTSVHDWQGKYDLHMDISYSISIENGVPLENITLKWSKGGEKSHELKLVTSINPAHVLNTASAAYRLNEALANLDMSLSGKYIHLGIYRLMVMSAVEMYLKDLRKEREQRAARLSQKIHGLTEPQEPMQLELFEHKQLELPFK